MNLLEWLRQLRLPWTSLPGRWAAALTVAKSMQAGVNGAVQALGEWFAPLARDAALIMLGAVMLMPRRGGETVASWRRRLTERRGVDTGTREWVNREANAMVTGAHLAAEMPRHAMIWGESYWGGDSRFCESLADGAIVIEVPTGTSAAKKAEVQAWFRQEIAADTAVNTATEGWDS